MNDLQRTDAWYLQRKGKITASEIFKILTKGRGKDELFGQTAKSYLDDKVAERLMMDEMFIYYVSEVKKSTPAMRWGTELEDTAREQYELAKGVKVEDCPFIAMEHYEDFVGGSPDGMLSTKDRIVEIKCPYSPAVQIEHCLWTKPEDLKTGNLQYYTQVQLNMIVTGTKVCDFISYSLMFRNGLDLHILEVPYDKEFCDNLVERIDYAVDYMRKKIELIQS